ncbi:hypothetical protein ES703_18523 [subsurface metagenome]
MYTVLKRINMQRPHLLRVNRIIRKNQRIGLCTIPTRNRFTDAPSLVAIFRVQAEKAVFRLIDQIRTPYRKRAADILLNIAFPPKLRTRIRINRYNVASRIGDVPGFWSISRIEAASVKRGIRI